MASWDCLGLSCNVRISTKSGYSLEQLYDGVGFGTTTTTLLNGKRAASSREETICEGRRREAESHRRCSNVFTGSFGKLFTSHSTRAGLTPRSAEAFFQTGVDPTTLRPIPHSAFGQPDEMGKVPPDAVISMVSAESHRPCIVCRC